MLSFELDCVIPMDILGVVEETTCDGRIIIRCDALPDIGDSVFAKGGRLGTVGRVFGPVDSPYASVNPVGGATAAKGTRTSFKGRKHDAKSKRGNRRDRGLSRVRKPPPHP